MTGELHGVRDAGRWRSLRTFDARGPVGELDGKPIVSYASNDYLGLSTHPDVIAAACAATRRWGTSATASRLVVGNRPAHTDLEHDIAEWKHTDRALVFATGYAANVSVLTVFGGPDVTVFSDELNHASIIDGCRLSRSQVVVYPHLDLDHLAEQLERTDGRSIVVTDAVFSMDGDLADTAALAALCATHDALLVLDEAHSVIGPEIELDPAAVIVRIGTLSKTLGSLGGFVASGSDVIDLLVNRARPFIFSTGLSPADAAAAQTALAILRSPEGLELTTRLEHLIHRVKPAHPSPIIPLIIGDERAALQASLALAERGILIPAIRPPTVPLGTSRLRLALSASHTDQMIDTLIEALVELVPTAFTNAA
jgi:8-amino-7-oxononanoate synthase